MTITKVNIEDELDILFDKYYTMRNIAQEGMKHIQDLRHKMTKEEIAKAEGRA